MERRQFLLTTGMATAAAAATTTIGGAGATLDSASTAGPDGHGAQDHAAIDGPLANAVVSFGAWRTTPPLDRHPAVSPGPANHHSVLPSQITIKAGGAVMFTISGFHQLAVYGPGTQASDISTATLVNGAGSPPLPPLIDDPLNRIYRGLDPGMQPRDRVEVVHFASEGTYLVICSVLSHFMQGMYGYIKVV